MNLSKTLFATCFATALVGLATPALAQHHGGGGGGHNGGGSASRGGASRGESGNRGGENRGSPRAVSPGPGSQGISRNAAAPRAYSNGGPRAYYSGRPGYVVRGGVSTQRYSSGVGRPYYSVVAPTRFYRPYYSFRPRLSVGFGLWAGYPFAYSYGFYDPFYSPYGYYGYPAYPSYPYGSVGPNGYPTYGSVPYPAYPPSGYPSANPPPSSYPQSGSQGSAYPSDGQGPQGSIGVQPPDQANMGGLSFEITPNTAQLFVDNTLSGTVGQFTPTSQPLGLVAGRHHVEVRAPGYQTISLDVDVIAGQVIPYQGTMER